MDMLQVFILFSYDSLSHLSDWFWIIKSDTTSSSAIMSPWKKMSFQTREAVKVDCSNKMQHWPSEVTHVLLHQAAAYESN